MALTSRVIRLQLDGSELWRTNFGGRGLGDRIAVAPSGNLVVAGAFEASMTVGPLSLEDDSSRLRPFVAELDAAGQATGLRQLELPVPIVSDDIGVGSGLIAGAPAPSPPPLR